MDIEANIDFLMGQNLRGKAISGWLARNAKAKRQSVFEKSLRWTTSSLRSCLNLIAEIYYSRFFDGFVLEMREHTGGM